MEPNKLRIKIGDHEFEAEGPAEVVQAQFAAFKELLATAPVPRTAAEPSGDQRANNPPPLDKIMKVEKRVVSLSVQAKSLEDAILLLLLGQKTFRNNDSVTGAEIVDGLTVSGQSKDGAGRLLKKIASEGNIIITGAHRGKRYRLTNQGVSKAQDLARDLIELIA